MPDDLSPDVPPSPPDPPEPSAVARPVSKVRWAIHLAIMAALPIVAGTAGASSRGGGPALGHSVKGLLMVCGFEILLFAVVFGLAWLFSRATKDDLLLRWRPGIWVVPLGVVYSVGIRIAVAVVVAIASSLVVWMVHATPAAVQKFAQDNRPKVETLVDVQALAHDPVYFWLTIVFVSFVMAGLREELWRSSFLAGLRSLWPRIFGSDAGGFAGAAVAALFFGAGHIPQGMLTAAMITVVGFLLGVIMSLHRSVWPSVVAHALFDAASLALLAWLAQHPEWQQLIKGA